MSEETVSNSAQQRKLGRGMVLSVAGVLTCWIPILGALLALIGLFTVISSYVTKGKGKYATFTVLSILCAVVSVGALMGMLYVYFGNPALLTKFLNFIMTKLNVQ